MFIDFTSIPKFTKKYEEFKKNILSKKPIFAFVHAHWCGHCTSMLPEWKAFVKKMSSNKVDRDIKDVVILDITDDVMQHILKTFPSDELASILTKYVIGFPTLLYMEEKKTKMMTKKTITSYTGGRTSIDFENFIKSKKLQNHHYAIKNNNNSLNGGHTK